MTAQMNMFGFPFFGTYAQRTKKTQLRPTKPIRNQIVMMRSTTNSTSTPTPLRQSTLAYPAADGR
jgi:hypothetical protein